MNAIALEPIPSAGSHVGRYQFLREIAKGPFGPLYELRSAAEAAGLSGLGRLITLPNPLAPEVEQAISEAAWDSMELRHDLTLCVADVVFGKGWVALVHDYSEGSMLRALQRRALERQSAFPVAVALRVILDVLDGLELNRSTCDDAGVTWRPGGTNATSLYLCGDGHTRSLDGQLMGTLLRFSPMRAHAGTVGYPPPELLSMDNSGDERTDVFTVGAVLWELLTGHELTLGSAIVAGQRPRPPAPNLNLTVPKGTKLPVSLTQAVQAALELDPSKRPATRSEFKSLLSNAVEAAPYERVIDYTDALLNRESTLFRLTLDRGPKLSDELRSERPNPTQMEWVLDLAKHARSVEEKRGERPIRAVDAGEAKPVPALPSEIFARPNKPTASLASEGAARPNPATHSQMKEGAARPNPATHSQMKEGAARPNKPTYSQPNEGAARPNKPTHSQTKEGAARPSKPTSLLADEGAARPSKPTPQTTAPAVSNKKLPSQTLMGISPAASTHLPPISRENKSAIPPGTRSVVTAPTAAATAPVSTDPDDDAAVESEMPPPVAIVDVSVANPAPTRGAAALLEASLEQLAAEKAARVAERTREPTTLQVPAAGAIPRSASENAGMAMNMVGQLPIPVEPREPVAQGHTPDKEPRKRVVQLTVSQLLLGFLSTVALSVLCTVAVVHLTAGSTRLSPPATGTKSGKAPAPSVAPVVRDVPPSASAVSAVSAESAVPKAVEPRPSASPVVTASPQPPLSTNLSGAAAPTAPQKAISKRRREQYVPHGL